MRVRSRRVIGIATTLLVALVAATLVFLASRDTDGSTRVRDRAAGPATTTTTTATPPPCTTTATTTTTTTTTTSQPSATTTTTAAVPAPPTGPVLRVGSTGPPVTALEQRLVGLGYWVGSVDGTYDTSTAHAVVAFQKWHGLARDGIAGPQVAGALAGAGAARPRSPSGRHVEIDLTRQVLLAVDGAGGATVLDISSGRVAGSTPVGHFTVTREIDGYRHSPLGVLYRPKYFTGGVAVHGYTSVPPWPASHGCVRTTNAAMDWLWAGGRMAVGSPVWVYR